MIAAVTPVEVAAALNRKLRAGRLTDAQFTRMQRVFHGHCRSQYLVITLGDQIYEFAKQLLGARSLRGYDAIQLATALQTARLTAGALTEFRFCTADRGQAAAAAQEGLRVELIQ